MSETDDSNSDAAELTPLPGLDVVGRGIYLRPYQPYTLKQLLFEHNQYREVLSRETHMKYALPVGYEVNDSPPLPTNEALNQVFIEESWDRFEKQLGRDTSAAVSSASFSISASASWNSRLRAEEEAFYATRSSFVPLWMVYIPTTGNCIPDVRDPDIPVPYDPEHRRAYDDFFRCFGSHYVRGAWVGGKSLLVFTVLKASQLDKRDIHAGIKASFSVAGGELNTSEVRSREQLKSSSQCTVIGKGGDEVKLAATSSLDASAYDEWLKTIPENPQVIELDVEGIWTFINDPVKAATIREAYREAVQFDPIKAVFEHRRQLYFIRGSRYVLYDRVTGETEAPMSIYELLPELEQHGFESIDEAFLWKGLSIGDDERNGKLYVFRRNRVLRINLETKRVDEGFPQLVSEAFPGVEFARIDAALPTGFDALYFFHGPEYVRFNPEKNRVEEGYPQSVSRRWVGVTFDRIDAAVYWGGGKVYFFRGDQHIRYDLAKYRADPGYPKYMIGNYIEDWKFIND